MEETSLPPLRQATENDLTAIVALLADDPLGAQREQFMDPLPEVYRAAFKSIDEDPNHQLIVADQNGAIAGVLQLSFLPNLTYQGRWRAQIEGVRIASARRGSGLGRHLLEHALDLARQRGCRLVQLTTDKARPDAIQFYNNLGFRSSHEGMKLHLD